jgi:hypothetical protein
VIYWVPHELRSLLRESVPYVKIYRYNTKHLCPKLNGYRDNGQRSVVFWWVHAQYLSADKSYRCLSLSVVSVYGNSAPTSLIPECEVSHVMSVLAIHVSCIVLGTLKDNYDISEGFFVVQFNGFMSLTS